jgi:hypothetical protein
MAVTMEGEAVDRIYLSAVAAMAAMAAILALAGAISASAQAAQPRAAASAAVARSGGDIRLDGRIDAAALAAVQRLAGQGAPPRALIVTSADAEPDAAMQLGRLVRRHAMEVRVEGLCASFCAFYLAPAARLLTVPAGSMVGFTTILHPAELGIAEALLSHPDTLLIHRPRLIKLRDQLRPLLDAQAAYFREIGVDGEKAVKIAALMNGVAQRLRQENSNRLMLVADAGFLKECLGVGEVAGAAPLPGETRNVGGSPRPLVAFVIARRVYHQAADQRIAASRYNCGVGRGR